MNTTGLQPEANGKTPTDLKPKIAERAYGLYEERGRQNGDAIQDWGKAEREVREGEAKGTESKADAKTDTKPDAKAEPKPEIKPPPSPSKTKKSWSRE
jgi:hypothetical protein